MPSNHVFNRRYLSIRALQNALKDLGFDPRHVEIIERYDRVELSLPRTLKSHEVERIIRAGVNYYRAKAEAYNPFHDYLVSHNKGKEDQRIHSLPRFDPTTTIPVLPRDSSKSSLEQGELGEISFELAEKDVQGSFYGLYSSAFASGHSSEVYTANVKTILAIDPAHEASTMGLTTTKVAIKRLNKDVSFDQFWREYNALRQASSLQHKNIVCILSAFRMEYKSDQYFNFLFPLAMGNLKRLFRGDVDTGGRALHTLWGQFEGLASAVTFLHETLHTAHRDIKPSNILLYPGEEQEPWVLKITDFGLAVELSDTMVWELGTKEAKSAWSYDAPEFRSSGMSKGKSSLGPLTSEALSNDIWKLGCVFLELEAFLVRGGSAGVSQLHQHTTNTVVTSDGIRIDSDDFQDNRFDDGEQIKLEVKDWIKLLSAESFFASQLEPILLNMLASHAQRPTARQVTMELLLSNLSHTANFFDGVREVTVLRYDPLQRRTPIDDWRIWAEDKLGCSVQWWPFPPIEYHRRPGQFKISWKMAQSQLSIVMSPEDSRAYIKSCTPLGTSSGALLPLHSQGSTAGSQVSHTQSTQSRISGRDMSAGSQPSRNVVMSQGQQTSPTKKLYLCIDKRWSDPRKTQLRFIPRIDSFQDDEAFYKAFKKELRRPEQSWTKFFLELVSWKSFRDVDFSEFYLLRDNTDRIERQTITELPIPLTGYSHSLPKPHKQHMMIVAKNIVEGVMDTNIGRQSTSVLDLIPKKDIPPEMAMKMGTQGWGLRPRYGFSVCKILSWIGLIEVLGLAFVAYWLSAVDSKDLQNAFVPVGFLTAIVAVAICLPQVLMD